MPALEVRRWTAAEVRQLTADNPLLTPRYELVHGELLVTPSPGAPHQRAVAALYRWLSAYLMPSKRLRHDGFPVYELLLAIEVVSPSSGRHDRVRKRPKYQAHTQEYWIVDPDARLFERWRPGDDRPEICIGAFTWHAPDDVPAFTLDVEQFFADVFRAEMA
ncbi:MAG: Uma2 family endonuclease [Polaromonas sp.]|nr:Uma2 family endonuclease [Gemmatimonadaceae bacterium]